MMKLARFNRVPRLVRRSPITSALCGALIATCWSLGLAPPARAQFDDEGGTIKLKDSGSGVLDVKYFNEQSASGTGGCLHIEVVSPSGPSPRDRNLEIVFYANFMQGGPRDGTAFRFPVRLPEGAARAEVAVPYVSPGRANHPGNQALVSIWDVAVFEDGHNVESLRTYSGSRGRAAGTTVAAGDRVAYHVTASNGSGWSMLRLVEDTAVPTSLQPEMFRLLSATVRDVNSAVSQSIPTKTNFGLSSDLQNVGNIRGLSSAPDQWLYYLQFNYVVLDDVVLERMRVHRPSVSEALKQYVASGGSVLLISSQKRGQDLVDQWLNESVRSQSPAVTSAPSGSPASGDWLKISAPVEHWWNRPSQPAAAAGNQAQAGAAGMMTMPVPTGAYGPGQYTVTYGPGGPYAVPVPAAPRPPSPPPVTLQAQAQVPQQASPSASSIAQTPKAETTPLSVGGCARDLLTALQTYTMAEFGTPLVIADKLVDVITGNDGTAMMASMGGMGVTSNVSANPSELSEIFEPLQARLEEAVSELEQQDTIGCSVRPYALGQIGVVQSSLNAHPLETLEQLIGVLDVSAAVRINSAQDSAWPWRNLISSVGKPPVWTFCAFVLLFGLLLGPGLLVFTGWMGRRSLLIFLVPCVSLVATILIAAYEILHEGFDTSIRISSVLTIDEPTGQGFAWSRQTYFSGWPPSGLEFPNEVYFRPVSEPQEYYRNPLEEPQRSVGNRLDIAEDRSRLTGWLSAREQQQLLIGHPAQPSVPLQTTRVDSQHVKIKNLTAEVLPFAVVRDGGEWYYLAMDLLPGAEVNCQAQTAYEVGVELTRIRAKHMPEAPLEMQGGGGWGWGRRYVAYSTGPSFGEVVDLAWQQYVSEHLSLPRYGFVTLQQSTDAVYVPLKGNVTECKHLVVGRLVW